MSVPVAPTNFNVQSANGQVYLSCDIDPAATLGFSIARCTDGIHFGEIAQISLPYYLDTTVTLGVQYFYQMAAINSDGTGAYTGTLSAIPVTTGDMCLGQIRLNAQQRADQVNSQFLTLNEWNQNINNSLFELYDLLVTAYGEEYFQTPIPAQFQVNGTSSLYPLPNGVVSFFNGLTGAPNYTAPPFYKLMGIDLAVNTQPNGWVSLDRFNFADRNKFFYPNSNSTMYGVFNMSYRVMGTQIQFIPVPSANQYLRIWYIPRMQQLLADTDITPTGVSGWCEYVIVDAAIKAMQKEESDCSVLMAQKDTLKRRIESAAANRDPGRPDTISDTSRINGGWGPGSNYKAGW